MSASLIRRGLQLLNDDIKDVQKVQKKKQQTPSSAKVMELVSTNRQGVTKQILNHNSGRQSRNRPEQPAKKAKESQSLFTEEEFQQFQKEYFGRTVEGKR
ncbi:hypothetical protein FQN60_012462 [Etheostoma spectabile]|uniref:Active regulator of SIRT1 n=1 Tax=Etheostoma spectabile TaxID=54343 RepID=A0A5J5DPF5_9PERO|nr:hypothetical protein FQN60_012462 [Etheostoma spectabile]